MTQKDTGNTVVRLRDRISKEKDPQERYFLSEILRVIENNGKQLVYKTWWFPFI